MGSAKFGRGGLAENDGTGFAQRPYGRIVALGEIAAKSLAAHLRGHILGVEQVLDADGHAVDGGEGVPSFPARRTLVSGGAGADLLQGDGGFDDRFALFDHLDAALKIVAGGVGALAKAGRGIMEGERLEGAGIVASGWTWVHGQHLLERHDRSRHKVAASSVRREVSGGLAFHAVSGRSGITRFTSWRPFYLPRCIWRQLPGPSRAAIRPWRCWRKNADPRGALLGGRR